MTKYLKPLFLFIGLLFLIVLINKVGVERIFEQILAVKEAFLWCIIIAGGWHILYAISWSISLGGSNYKITLKELFQIRLAGEAMNGLTPFIGLGGEPLKIHLLGKLVRLDACIGSVMIEKTMFITSGIVVMTLGTLLSMIYLNLDPFTKLFLATATMAGITILGAAFTHRGARVFTVLTDGIRKLRFHPGWLDRSQNFLAKLDTYIVTFYTDRPAAFASSALCHFAARFLGVIEMWIILYALGADLTLLQIVYIWSLTNFFSQVFSFIPSSIGALEGSQAFLLMTLGQDPMLGLVLGIIRRTRQLCFLSLGLVFLAMWGGIKPVQST